MVRLADLPDYEREHLLAKNMPPLGPATWVASNKPLSELRIALVISPGSPFPDVPPFEFTDATFRPISNDENANDLIMSHSSVNFDRTGLAEDVNLVYPIDRFKELEARGAIGSLANVHYSFMGAGLMPTEYQHSASQLAGMLKKDRVDAVFLTPV